MEKVWRYVEELEKKGKEARVGVRAEDEKWRIGVVFIEGKIVLAQRH